MLTSVLTDVDRRKADLGLSLDDLEFSTSDSFSPDFDSSSASLLWYKAGQTAPLKY